MNVQWQQQDSLFAPFPQIARAVLSRVALSSNFGVLFTYSGRLGVPVNGLVFFVT